MKTLVLFVLLALVSCTQDTHTPEAALKSFVEMRMGTITSRNSILERTTGPMRQSLENISEEEFKKFSDLSNVQRESFKVLSKSCQQSKCFVTYSLSYKTLKEKTPVFLSEVKKIAEMHESEGKWLISEVSNIKTYHESTQPIDALSDKAQ